MKLTIELTKAQYAWLDRRLHRIVAKTENVAGVTSAEDIWHKLREAYGAAVRTA